MTKEEATTLGIRISRLIGYILMLYSAYKLQGVWLAGLILGFIAWMPMNWLRPK